MQGDSSTWGVVVGGSLGDALDCGGAARGTYQRLLVPIRSDQDQRLRRPILLDAPASHRSCPSDGALVARRWLTPWLLEIYRSRAGRATLARFSSDRIAGRMTEYFRMFVAIAALAALGARPAVSQEVHEIRMEADGKGEFRFAPSSVTARRGDVLLFKAVRGAPHSVVFEGKNLSAQAREKLNAALPRRAGDLSSPLLTQGSEYRMVVPHGLAAGTYRFFCLPHKAYDMRGELTVK